MIVIGKSGARSILAWQKSVMTLTSTLRRLHASLIKSAGTVVFGMEDGTVSIFGLIFGVAATTSSTATVVIAGATGAVAAAVSMMAGVYLDAETTRDALAAKKSWCDPGRRSRQTRSSRRFRINSPPPA